MVSSEHKSEHKRTRGPNRGTPWARRPEDGVSVLRLALDTYDPVQRRRVETMFTGAYQVRRAIQRAARDKARAYWAARHERAKDPAAVRDRLGLSRTALEHTAYAHLDAAPHLRRSVTKALAMHLADSVWTSTERHLFRDARGRRHGAPHVGRWFEFHRLPGRARSHTTPRKWETFRLHGSLAGHRAAYTDRTGDFVQPRQLQPIECDAWWTYEGPLAVVFSGLADGTLVLPVRLPTAPCNQPILDHHLGDPSRWHKVDLVRTRDPNAAGGWRYEAHLVVLTAPYERVPTRPTALSQHCPCGARVEKTLADRVHGCAACGLCGDRDAVAAVLASFVVSSGNLAHVDYDATRAAHGPIGRLLRRSDAYLGWQGTPSESTDLSAREGSFLAWSTSTPDTASRHVVVARRTVGMAAGPTLNEPGVRQITSERARWRTGMSSRTGPTRLDSLWDKP